MAYVSFKNVLSGVQVLDICFKKKKKDKPSSIN